MGSVVNDETARVGALLRTSSQELICEPSELEWLVSERFMEKERSGNWMCRAFSSLE